MPMNNHRSAHTRKALLPSVLRSALVLLCFTPLFAHAADVDASRLPESIPEGTRLVFGDQNEKVQTLLKASGHEEKLGFEIEYANFRGGPAILEAFRAGALDIATVGSTPPIQAQVAGEDLPIVAAAQSSEPAYGLAVSPGAKVTSLKALKGTKIAYAEGTARQPFVLKALREGGLGRKDVTLVPLRVDDFVDALRTGQVDVAALTEPHFSRYIGEGPDRQERHIPFGEHAVLPRELTFLYASAKSLKDEAKAAAIVSLVKHWIAANQWAEAHPEDWAKAFYVDRHGLSPQEARRIIAAQGKVRFPALEDLIAGQQADIDLLHEVGDIPSRLDARDEFDLRFDPVIARSLKAEETADVR